MKLYLIKEQVWDVVEAEVKAKDKEKDQFVKKNLKAYADIGLCIEDNMIQHIKDTTSAFTAWQCLEKHCIPKNRTSRMSIFRTLCRMRIQKNGNMDDHISALVDNIEKLKSIGDKDFADQHAICFLLNSVSDEYDNLITAMDSIPESELTLEYAKERLKAEWMKRNDHCSEENGTRWRPKTP